MVKVSIFNSKLTFTVSDVHSTLVSYCLCNSEIQYKIANGVIRELCSKLFYKPVPKPPNPNTLFGRSVALGPELLSRQRVSSECHDLFTMCTTVLSSHKSYFVVIVIIIKCFVILYCSALLCVVVYADTFSFNKLFLCNHVLTHQISIPKIVFPTIYWRCTLLVLFKVIVLLSSLFSYFVPFYFDKLVLFMYCEFELLLSITVSS